MYVYFFRLKSILMSVDKLEMTVSSFDNDDKSEEYPSRSSLSSKIQATLANCILSPSDTRSSSVSSVTSSSIRRKFNICDILAKPSSFVDSDNNNNNHYYKNNCLIHRWKRLIQRQSPSDDEINDSISDCDEFGKETFFFCFCYYFLC